MAKAVRCFRSETGCYTIDPKAKIFNWKAPWPDKDCTVELVEELKYCEPYVAVYRVHEYAHHAIYMVTA